MNVYWERCEFFLKEVEVEAVVMVMGGVVVGIKSRK
jgi:hypothetical protein